MIGLPSLQTRVMVGRVWCGKTFQQISTEEGFGHREVARRVYHRSLRIVRDRLEDRSPGLESPELTELRTHAACGAVCSLEDCAIRRIARREADAVPA